MLVNAYTDFADFITGLFGRGQHPRIFKHERLSVLVDIRGILYIHNAVRTLLVAVLLVADNGFCQHNVIFLVVPVKFDRIALLGQHKTIRRLNLGNAVLAQRQGHGHFAFGAIMGNFQEIIGCLRAGGAECYFIHLTFRAGGNSCHQIAGFVPVGTLAVWCGNVGCSVNFVHCACETILRVDELTILVIGQDIAQLTDGKGQEPHPAVLRPWLQFSARWLPPHGLSRRCQPVCRLGYRSGRPVLCQCGHLPSPASADIRAVSGGGCDPRTEHRDGLLW